MKATLITCLAVFVISLFAAGKSFSTPVQKSVTQLVKAVEYQQTGSFDYAVKSRPPSADTTGTAVLLDPIPLSRIESFQVRFSYDSPHRPGKGIQASAVLEYPGVWQKTFPLVAENGTSKTSVFFALDINTFQDDAQAIDKELGLVASSLDLTVRAVVPDGTTSLDGSPTDFIQSLPLTLTKSSVTIGDSLTSTQGMATGTFSYQVKLLDNDLYGPVTLTPPTPPTEQVLGPNDTIFVKLADSMIFSYSYKFAASKPVTREKTEVGINAIISSGDKWSKTYMLVPPTSENGDFTVSFPLDVKQVIGLFDSVQQNTGVMASSENLTLQATVHTVGQTASGPIDRTLVQTISTDLRSGVMTWNEGMQKKSPGSIDTTQITTESARLWGTNISEVRAISASAAVIMLLLLSSLLLAYYLRRPSEAALAAEKVKEIDRKYKAMIVQVTEAPNGRVAETVLPVDSVEDLIKVGQGLLKPVHHNASDDGHVYWVYDDTKRYEYHISNGKSPPAKKNAGNTSLVE